MVRRLLNFLRKPNLDLPDSVQPVTIRELEDKESIHADFDRRGFSIIILRPKHTVQSPMLEHRSDRVGSFEYPEYFGDGGYL